jgi:lipopolysaccharide exporter
MASSAEPEGNGSATIAGKVASGTIWTVSMRLGIRLIGMISVIILARLLLPDDFGIVAQASMINSFLELVTAFGFESALIQNQKATAAHYNTVWTLNVARGIVNATALVLLAYPAAVLLHEERLHAVIYFYALSSFLRGFANVGTVDFRKEFQFNRDFQFEMWSKLAGFVVTISAAWVWRSYWAFIAGVLSTSATIVLSSFIMSKFRPRFSLEMWRPLLRFSKWVFGAELLNAVATKLDTFVLSRYSTAANVGTYTVSYEIAMTPSSEIAMPVARALMAGLSKVSDDAAQFRTLYLSTISLVLLVSIPAGVGVSALAHYVTLVLLGEKWLGAIPLIEILALFGITRAVIAVSTSAFMSFGRVDLLGKITSVAVVLRIAGVLIGFHLGDMIGVAWGILVASSGQALITLVVQDRVAMLEWRALMRACWRPILAAAAMASALKLSGVAAFFADFAPLASLIFQVGFGAAVFASTLALFWWLDGSNHGPELTLVNYLKSRLGRLSPKNP